MKYLIACTLLIASLMAEAQERKALTPGPDRKAGEGGGPYDQLIIRGVTMIDGTGAPPTGPVDIVVEKNKIVDIRSVGVPHIAIDPAKRPKLKTKGNVKEIDATGKYIMPGLIDLHVHTGGEVKAEESEYVYKLWMANGITTVRGVPFGPLEWSVSESQRSAKNEIVAPRMIVFQRMGTGKEWANRDVKTPEDAKEWVRYAKSKGVHGFKLGSHRPEIMKALLDEANAQGMGTTAHLAQSGVAQMNALDAARLGLTSMTHFYGLFESMYENHDVQPWPYDINYGDEQHRFGQVARQWDLVKPGGEKWNALLDEFLENDFFINPTMTIYSAGRDVMRARNADWHEKYTLPSQMDFFQPSRVSHGAYWFDWTTADEVAWKKYYQIWMQFLNEYKNRGGKITLGSDSGYIYELYGFGTILELEMLQEAGLHPLEVIRAGTMHAAEEVFYPKKAPIEYGVIREGLIADMIIVGENPLQNLKVLYGTGAVRLNDDTGKPERVGGIEYTIKDGIVYDAKQLLRDVEAMVNKQKAERPADTNVKTQN